MKKRVNLPKADDSVLLGKEMRSLFIAPPGSRLVGFDGNNLESVVAASYAYHYDKGDYFRKLGTDSHSTNAEAYTIAAGRLVTRTEGKNITYACCPVDTTQVLTKTGLKWQGELVKGELVQTYNPKKECMEWKEIQEIVVYSNQPTQLISNGDWEFEATEDHYWWGMIGNESKFFKTNEITPLHKILTEAGEYVSGLVVTESRTTDVFCITTENMTFVAKQGSHITVTGNCLYGAQAKKIAKMLGISVEAANAVINSFWDTNFGLKALKEDLEQYWEATGKRYIRGITGCKIFTRSKHSLVNALFQSCGSLLMCLSGCYMYDMLTRRGLLDQGVTRLVFMHK